MKDPPGKDREDKNKQSGCACKHSNDSDQFNKKPFINSLRGIGFLRSLVLRTVLSAALRAVLRTILWAGLRAVIRCRLGEKGLVAG